MSIALCCIYSQGKNSVPKDVLENCKALKKQLGVKEVSAFETDIEAPFFKYETKDKKCGVIDKTGKVIIPAEYYDVMYFPAHGSNEISINMLDEKKFNPTEHYVTVPTEPTIATFVANSEKNGVFIFDTSGQLLKQYPQNCVLYSGNYLYLEYVPYESNIRSFPVIYNEGEENNGIGHYSFSNKYHKMGHGALIHSDGTMIIPEVEGFTIKTNNPCVVYSIYDDGMTYYGMKRLDDEGFDIPAEFYSLEYKPASQYYAEGWYVKPRRTDSFEKKYEPTESYKTGVRDKGEMLYSKAKYDEVLDYYANEGVNAPWAKFYSGAALSSQIGISIMFFKNNVESMEKGGGLPAKNKYHITDPNAIMDALYTIKNLFNAYLASGDTEFAQNARDEIEVADYRIEQMNEYIYRYNNAYNHAAAVSAQQQAQQAAFLNSLLSSFASSLNSTSQNTSNAQAHPTGTNATTKTYGSGTSVEDNSGRKAFLRGQIADWKNKLNKAEASYRQAVSSGDDTWEKKRVIDSKRQTVEECLQMIKQFESELNSLK